jgi:hypothetical protein
MSDPNKQNEGGCIHLLLLPIYLLIAVMLAPGIIVDTLKPGYFGRGFTALLGIIGFSIAIWGSVALLVALFTGSLAAVWSYAF